jgi:hypothetical protein
VLRHAAQDEQVREHVDDVDRAQLAADPDCQALTGELVDDVEHAVLPSVVGPVLDEIVGPDVVRVLRPQPGAGSVVEPETALLGLPGRNFEPLPSPEPLDPLAVHHPASRLEQRRDPAIAVAAVPGCKGDDLGGQRRLIVGPSRRLALCGAMLPQNPAGPPLRHAELGDNMLHTGATTGGA